MTLAPVLCSRKPVPSNSFIKVPVRDRRPSAKSASRQRQDHLLSDQVVHIDGFPVKYRLRQILEAANQRIYHVPTLPTMSTFATDMAQLRAKGMQCYGIGPAVDLEDGPKGFGMHSDQERLLESELHRFVRFNWDVVVNLARAR